MLIGFTGKAGVGKSTACKMVMEDLPDVKHINFKDGLVRELKEKFPDLLEQIAIETGGEGVDSLFSTKPPLMRTLMQNFGTDVRRKDDPDYWIEQWMKSVLENQQFHIVCDDVRFINEANALKKLGGTLVRITRDDITNTGSHQSEVEMDQIEVDVTISGVAGDHENLHKQVRELYTPELIPTN